VEWASRNATIKLDITESESVLKKEAVIVLFKISERTDLCNYRSCNKDL